MERKKIVGIIGSGEIGRDPYDPLSWSGCSSFFFKELERRSVLHRAIGVEVGLLRRYWLMAKNYNRNRKTWRRHFYLDIAYRDGLTREIARRLVADDFCHGFLQIGALYDVPTLVADCARCYLYADGNLAQSMRSPAASKNVDPRRIDRALDYERNVYNHQTMVFAMSEYLRRSFIQDFGVPEDRVAAVGAGVNLDIIPDPDPNKKYDTREILFVGVEFERKGGRQLLEAFAVVRRRVPGAILHIVGPSALEVDHRLQEGVVFHGFLSKRNDVQRSVLQDLYSRCCLFVMPSLYEPFGVAPLEAMVHQIPCILTNGWALKEFVTPGVNGELVECGSVEDLESKLTELLSDEESLRRMGERGRMMTLERYTWSKVVDKMSALLNN